MLRLTADLHTHTVFSHGKGTPEDNIKAAISLGLSKIAISDHSYKHAFYGIRDLEGYVETILGLKEKYKDKIDVLLGIETNLLGLKGEFDLPKKYADKFDIVILGYHKGSIPPDLPSLVDIGILHSSQKLTDKHMCAFEKALSTGKIDVLAHPGYAISTDKLGLAQMCEKYGVLFEINNKHPELTAEDIHLISDNTKVNFLISTDAHHPSKVGRPENSIKKALEAGIPVSRIFNAEEV